MNICELYKELQDNILDDLNGELILQKKSIVWSYNLDNDGITEDLELTDDEEYDFTSATSPEEMLQQGYDEDLEVIEAFIAQLDDYADWTFSDPEISDTIISFRIY